MRTKPTQSKFQTKNLSTLLIQTHHDHKPNYIDPKTEDSSIKCQIQKNEPTNILQYADDTVFVGEATWDNLLVLKVMLRGYEMVSGLKINYAKSQLVKGIS